MRLDLYNSINMTLQESGVSGISFGNVPQGKRSRIVPVILPVKTEESEISNLNVYLSSKGPYKSSEFGYFITGVPFTGVASGSDYLSSHFISGVSGSVPMAEGDFLWLDMVAGARESGAYQGITFTFTFDYV